MFKERAPERVRGQALTREQYTHTHMYPRMCTYAYPHTYTTHLHTHVFVRSHTCTHMCTYGHEHTNTHTHTLLPPGTLSQGQLLPLCGHCHLSDWGPDPNCEPPSPWAQIITTPSLIIVFIFLLYKLYMIIYLIIDKIKNVR